MAINQINLWLHILVTCKIEFTSTQLQFSNLQIASIPVKSVNTGTIPNVELDLKFLICEEYIFKTLVVTTKRIIKA
jgi:hypothetical protein